MSDQEDTFIPEDTIDPTIAKEILTLFGELPPKDRKKVFQKLYKTPLPSSHAYYQEKWALQILPDIVEAMSTGDVLMYSYEDYPRWKGKTLYLYVTNALRYLIEFMDSDNKIKEWRQSIEVRQMPTGVFIVPKKSVSDYKLGARKLSHSEFLKLTQTPAQEVEPTNSGFAWRNDLFAFMESASPGDSFERKNLLMSDDEVTSLRTMFETDELFGLKISSDKTSFMVRRL